MIAGARSLHAQQVNPRVPPPPPPADTSAAAPAVPAQPPAPQPADATPPSAKPTDTKPIDPSIPPPPPEETDDDAPAAPSGPVFDPLHAQRSMNIGTFYFKKGAYDAAIDRFVEASNYQPGLATPWRLLGEAYEKKHEYAKAVEAYNKYLDKSPRAADSAKIKKLVSELEDKIAQDSPRKADQ